MWLREEQESARKHGAKQDAPSSALRARWLVRVIVSLLTMPGASEEEERIQIERFVVPAIL